MTLYLLADQPLPAPPGEAEYPGLKLEPVEEEAQAAVLAGIRRVAPATFAYQVSPDGYCGCYFCHETPEAFVARMTERQAEPDAGYPDTPEQAEALWRGQTSALKSFARYLAAHADASLAVYVVWEHCAGQKEPTRAAVPPSYFDGPGFAPLPEDLVLTIIPESAEGDEAPWDPAAPRTDEWLPCGECGVPGFNAPDPAE